jgi:LPXTG-motif cell wall-anchored protein
VKKDPKPEPEPVVQPNAPAKAPAKATPTKTVKTGDTQVIFPFVLMVGAALITLIAVSSKRKKKED